MSNAGKILVSLMCGRVSKSKDAANGMEHAGIYYPAHPNATGGQTPARWEGNVFVNGIAYTDPANGQRVEPKPVMIRIVAWNGSNAKPGKGVADICAKSLSPGKEISGSFSLRSFDKRLFLNNVPQVGTDGQQLTYPALSFILEGLPIFGNDAEAVILAEINAFRTTGQATAFGSRPTCWNVPGHNDQLIWNKIKEARRELAYQPGMAMYGYAKVIVPAGAQAPTMGTNAALLAQIQALQNQINGNNAAAPTTVINPTVAGGADITQLLSNPTILAQMLALSGGGAAGTTSLPNVPPVTAGGNAMLNGGNVPL